MEERRSLRRKRRKRTYLSSSSSPSRYSSSSISASKSRSSHRKKSDSSESSSPDSIPRQKKSKPKVLPNRDYLRLREVQRVDHRDHLSGIRFPEAAFVFKDQNSFLVVSPDLMVVVSKNRLVYRKVFPKNPSELKQNPRMTTQSVFARSLNCYIIYLDGLIYSKCAATSQPPKLIWNPGPKRKGSIYELLFSEKLKKLLLNQSFNSNSCLIMLSLKSKRSQISLRIQGIPEAQNQLLVGGRDEYLACLNSFHVLLYSYLKREVLGVAHASQRRRGGQLFNNELRKAGRPNQFFMVSICSSFNWLVDLTCYEVKSEKIYVKKVIKLLERSGRRSYFLDMKGLSGGQFDLFGIFKGYNRVNSRQEAQLLDFSTESGSSKLFKLNRETEESLCDLLGSAFYILTFGKKLWMLMKGGIFIQAELSLAKKSEADTTKQFRVAVKSILMQ